MDRSRIYGPEYRSQFASMVRASAQVVVPMLLDAFKPTRVVDIGCGDGAWLVEIQDRGIEDVLGIDHFAPAESLRIPLERFRDVDLDAVPAHVMLPWQADLAICLEVAEHLKPQSSDAFIDGVVGCAPVIAFSAAIPAQGGVQHINEQWQSAWAGRFSDRGFERLDMIRSHVWDDDRVSYWYAQNTFVYARPDAITDSAREMVRPLPVDLVHPRMFEDAILRERSGWEASRNFARAVRRRLPDGKWRFR